jgi:hypothetical protein
MRYAANYPEEMDKVVNLDTASISARASLETDYQNHFKKAFRKRF